MPWYASATTPSTISTIPITITGLFMTCSRPEDGSARRRVGQRQDELLIASCVPGSRVKRFNGLRGRPRPPCTNYFVKFAATAGRCDLLTLRDRLGMTLSQQH